LRGALHEEHDVVGFDFAVDLGLHVGHQLLLSADTRGVGAFT
jgi:hypothetical protein